jgi:hypothetical protein
MTINEGTNMIFSAPKKVLSLGVAGAVAAMLLTGCGASNTAPSAEAVSSDDEYVQICYDKETEERVDDDHCDGDLTNSHYAPSYYHYDSMIPAIGTALLVGHLLSPPAKSKVYRGAVPRTGGYAPTVRPNSGFLQVPADFKGGVPPIPKAPTSVPAKAASTPPAKPAAPKAPAPAPAAPKVPSSNGGSTNSGTGSSGSTNSGGSTTNKAPSYKSPEYKAPAYKAPSYKAPSRRK